MPANWQAQCRVAASQRFCSTVTRWSPGRKPTGQSRPPRAEILRDTMRIGQPHVAVDDGERVRVARDACEEACSEIKHRACCLGRSVAAASSAAAMMGRSRCSGRDGRRDSRGVLLGRSGRRAQDRRRSDIRIPAVQKPHCRAWWRRKAACSTESRSGAGASPSTVRISQPSSLHRERQAGTGRHAVDRDRAGAAHAMLAADMRARRAELVAQCIGQQHAGLDLDRTSPCRSA